MPAIPIQAYPGCCVRVRLPNDQYRTLLLENVGDVETARDFVARNFPRAEFVEIQTASQIVAYQLAEDVTPYQPNEVTVAECPPGATAEAERIDRLPKKQYTLQPKSHHRWILIPAYACASAAGFAFAEHRTWLAVALFAACEAFLILRVLIQRPWRAKIIP